MTRIICTRLTLGLVFLVLWTGLAGAEDDTFSFTLEQEMDAPVAEVYDAATGDISGWWDHTMSEAPLELYVEARPGGAFMEIFDESGDGARHAVVTYARRNEMLRYEGPLGLAGQALHMVTTWSFTDAPNGRTLVTVEVHGAGEVHEGWARVIENTWLHFLTRLKDFVEEAP